MPVSSSASMPVPLFQSEDRQAQVSDYEQQDQDIIDENRTVHPGNRPIVRVNPTHPVVEISSSSSGAGKTQLLYYLTAIAVLPTSYSEVRLDGKNGAVVFIDTDGRFDARRLQAVARGIVQRKLRTHFHPKTPDMDIDSLLISTLQHVHVLRPQSSSSLLYTLRNLDTYLFDLKRHFSSSRPLEAIILDSATAFFWHDKLRDEAARVEEIGRPFYEIECERAQKRSFVLGVLYAELVAELRRLQQRFGCVVYFTCMVWGGKRKIPGPSEPESGSGYGLYSPGSGSGFGIRSQGPSLRPPLPAPWGIFPHLRLMVQRNGVRPFPPGMTADEAKQDAPMRHEIVRKGRFSVCVNAWGSEGWPSRVVEGLKRRNGFGFYVDGDGVGIAE